MARRLLIAHRSEKLSGLGAPALNPSSSVITVPSLPPLPADFVWQPATAAEASWPVFPGADTFTLAVRLERLKPDFTGDLLFWRGSDGNPVLRLSTVVADGPCLLVCEVCFDAKPAPLRLAVPVTAFGPDEPHELVVRHLGYRLELCVDGVLVDEEWPHGRMLPTHNPAAIKAARKAGAAGVSRLTLWNRALTDDEVQAISGGRAGLAAREDRYLGPVRPVAQYWRPPGFNVNVGDCMPLFHAGRFHLFYLIDRRHHASMWGCGGHQWAHASTTDLVHWEHHPLALAIDGHATGSICTGSVFVYDGIFRAFYAVRMADGSPSPLGVATSRDGITFTKGPALATLGAPYDAQAGRDPVVFRDAATGLFHMLVTTALAKEGGCLAELVSKDLEHWEQRAPFFVPGSADQPECADYFAWRGWYYLLFSLRGVTYYRMSRQATGPWEKPASDTFDGACACVLKTAAYQDDRRLGAAFVPDGGWGGSVVFRELIQHADGTLGTQWPAELVPATDGKLPLAAAKATPVDGPGILLGETPFGYLLDAKVKPVPGVAGFGLRVRDEVEVRFEPAQRRVSISLGRTNDAGAGETVSIDAVSGLDRPFAFRVVVKADIVDVSVDGRRTLVARVARGDSNCVAFFAHGGSAEFSGISARLLA